MRANMLDRLLEEGGKTSIWGPQSQLFGKIKLIQVDCNCIYIRRTAQNNIK